MTRIMRPADDPLPYDKVCPAMSFVWMDRGDTKRCMSHSGHHGVLMDEEGGFVRVLVRVYHPPSDAVTAFIAASPTAVGRKYETWDGAENGHTVVSIAVHEVAALASLPDVTRVELSKRYRHPTPTGRRRSRPK